MAVAINGNGTVTGISVGGLPDGIVDTDMIAADAVTDPKVVLSGAAKAWIKFNGNTTGAILNSFGITSISNPDTAEYIITFSTAFANANYVATACVSGSPAIHRGMGIVDGAQTTTSCRVNIFSTSGGGDHEDTDENGMAFFGAQ
jgi:hypothetical protein